MDQHNLEPVEYEPHPGIKLDIGPSGAVTTTSSNSVTQNRRSSIVPDQLLRSLRERSRDSYQKIRDLPRPFQYAATPAAPLIQTVNTGFGGRSMDETICEGPVVAPGPSGGRSIGTTGCLSTGGRCVDEIKKTAKGWVGRVEGVMVFKQQQQVVTEKPTEQTLRVKNNRTGHCVYIVTTSSSGIEELFPVDSLKQFFPNSKYLRTSLVSWNRHFQNPPQHWLINFIPRAYLRRGYFLAEEICNYLLQYPDGCKYRVEYEPIGHESSLVGTIVPRGLRARAKAGRYRDGREKEKEI